MNLFYGIALFGGIIALTLGSYATSHWIIGRLRETCDFSYWCGWDYVINPLRLLLGFCLLLVLGSLTYVALNANVDPSNWKVITFRIHPTFGLPILGFCIVCAGAIIGQIDEN